MTFWPIFSRVAVTKIFIYYVHTYHLNELFNNTENEGLDIELMIDDFTTFFIAGQETTANTLGFCFLELGKNPRVLEK